MTVPWATGEPTRMGWVKGGAGVCVRTGVWIRAEIIPGCPPTGNIWQNTGELATADGDREAGVGTTMTSRHALVRAAQTLLVLGVAGRAREGSWAGRPLLGAAGGAGGACWAGGVSAVWRMTLVAMALQGGGVPPRETGEPSPIRGKAGLGSELTAGVPVAYMTVLAMEESANLGL